MINDHLIKLKLLTAAGLFMCLFLVESKAQLDTNDTPEATKENNIICFAAKKKWVCAPADEKEKAQEKAIKLALGQNEETINTRDFSQPVEIQTLEPNNISQQVQEGEDPIQSAIKDFIPREAAASTKETVPQESVETIAASKQSPESDINQTQEADIQASQPANEQPRAEAGKGNFNQWQSQYAEQWTFQVIGTSNRHHLDGFLLKHGLDQTNYSIVKTQAKGADWWVVLSGLYNSREAALSQRDNLPEQLSANAWVRQIKTIVGQAD